ncbi:MAG: carbon-nitrogen hydrolase family protein, partial [Gemmatimonadota bacterium]|nr:carbon-nitrogen hydrolase family protein [Gemmatimonadota bacterium]
MGAKQVTVAVIQAEVAADLKSGLEKTAELTHDAVGSGAELIVFPETWIPGYPVWLDVCRDAALWNYAPAKQVFARMAENSISVPGPELDFLADLARDVGATLVLGISEVVK